MEGVTGALSNLIELLGLLEQRAKVKREIAELLSRKIHFGSLGDKRASFAYIKELGELPPSKGKLLELLKEFSYAPYSPGMRVKLTVSDAFVHLAEEGATHQHTIGSGATGPDGFTLSFLLKLALYFDERDWEAMMKLAREKLREETELLEKLKTIAAAIELLLK